MRTRDLLRHVPGLGRLLDSHRRLADENARLRRHLHQLSLGALTEPGLSDNGLSLPAASLRFLVAGTDDLGWFLRGGARAVESLRGACARQGRALADCRRVLDFGCGCGRVLRHLAGLTAAELHGCDPNTAAVGWCQQHLPFARCFATPALPPAGLPGGYDLIYALSIFTHLPEAAQQAWLAELAAALAPGGLLVLSLHGDRCAGCLRRHERAAYAAGRLVERRADVSGANECATFHPPAYVRRAFTATLDLADHAPEGAWGNPPQDLYVFRAPLAGRPA